MGELTTQSAEVMKGFLTRVKSARDMMLEAAKTGDRVWAAFAEAQARTEMLKTMQEEAIAAHLLAITDARIGMVELVNEPSPEDRIRVCAMALLNGFVPGSHQFSVFRGKGPASLYIKEAGYRQLFAHLGVSPIVKDEFPTLMKMPNGKSVWRVKGSAACTWQGQSFEVTFDEKNAIGIPGYESDNIDGISSKARRRMLKLLWGRVSPILNSDGGIEDPDEMPQDKPAAITHEPTAQPELTELQRDRIAAESDLQRARDMVNANEDHLRFVNRSIDGINESQSLEMLKAVAELMAEDKKQLKVSERALAILRRLYQVRERELQEAA